MKLTKGETLRIEGPCEIHLFVRSGALWATASPACGDHLLRSGERGSFRSRGVVILEALAETKLEVSVGTAVPHRRNGSIR